MVAFVGCDKVDAPYRETVVVNDYCKTGIEDSVEHKKVLVEDYTGHLCGNCPYAGVFLNDTLKPIYGHCMVVISVHAGFFAGTCPNAIACPGNQPAGAFTTNFTCATGNTWNTFFGVTGNPKGMIDRIDYPNRTHVKPKEAWATSVANRIELASKVRLRIENTYTPGTRNVDVRVTGNLLENLPGDYKLQVVLTEDSLIDWQEWYNHTPEYVPDYLHRHVLRDAVNSTWGENFVVGSAPAGSTVIKNYSYAIGNAFNVDHCNIVAFIYDANTYEVLQVEEKAVR